MSRKSKLKLYWSVIRPIAVYGCEAWVLKESIIQRLSVFGWKILRKIVGPTKEDNVIGRIKTNNELDELKKNHRNITNYVKDQRLSWFGHTNRMPETSNVRKIFGSTKEANGIWRIKTNKELDELIKHRNIINYASTTIELVWTHK